MDKTELTQETLHHFNHRSDAREREKKKNPLLLNKESVYFSGRPQTASYN